MTRLEDDLSILSAADQSLFVVFSDRAALGSSTCQQIRAECVEINLEASDTDRIASDIYSRQ
jgi:hypothetical protein